MRLVGILLIIVGVVAFTYGGFSYIPVEISTRGRSYQAIPPVVGIAALIGGIALVLSRRRAA